MANAFFEKYKSPLWQKKRLEVLENADWTCEVCQDSNSQLHVHHKKYFKGRDPWDYENDQLAVLCESCHEDRHNRVDLLSLVCSKLPVDGMKWIDQDKAAHLLAGIMGLENWDVSDPDSKAWFFAGLHVQDLADAYMDKFRNEAQNNEADS
jgi:hypothetical protein